MDGSPQNRPKRPEVIRSKVPSVVREHAKEFRKAMTPAERHLWNFLRDRRLAGRKFRRQHPLGIFVADFYCQEALLLVEVDGAVHEESTQAERDRNRDAAMREHGLATLRFSNQEVLRDTAGVLRKIEEYVLAHSEAEPAAGRSPRRWSRR